MRNVHPLLLAKGETMSRHFPRNAQNADQVKVWDKKEQRFRIGASNEYVKTKPVGPDDMGRVITTNPPKYEMSTNDLREQVYKKTGIKPHHRTGRKKLMEMLHEHASATQG